MISKIKVLKSIFGLVSISLIFYSYSTGPGAGGQRVAGSPVDQGTCVICHNSHPLNSGAGSIIISGISQYTPGSTYNMTVSVSNSSINRHGFQMVALIDNNMNNAGSFSAGTGQHVVTLQGHDYIEHATPSASGVFNFTWTAPSSNVGNITFYAAGNAAENPQGNTSGDYIYSTSLTVSPPPVPPIANFGADTTTSCTGNQIIFTDSSSGTISTWSWDFGAGASPATSALQSPPPVIYTTTGLKTISLTVSGSAGSDTKIRSNYISINQTPTVSVLMSTDTICLGDSAIFTASGAATYSWSPASGLSATSGQIVKASPATTTSYILTGTSAAGCTDQALIKLVVVPKPLFTLSGGPSVCLGDKTQLIAGSLQLLSYQWSPAASLSCSNCAAPFASPTTTTTYTVTATNIYGCTQTDSITIQVNPLPSVSASVQNDSLCLGNTTTLHASGTQTYQWSPANGLSCTNCADPLASPLSTTVYTVTGSDANGCSNTDSVKVIVLPLPVVSAGTDVSICAGSSTNLSASGAISYLWSPASALSCTNCANPLATPAVSTVFTVSGTDIYGCVNSDQVNVTVNPLPVINISANDTICAGQKSDLLATGGVFYSWMPTTGLNCSLCANPVATPNQNTTYTVTVTDANNCVNIDSVHIEVEPAINLALSPNASICAGDSISLTASGASNYQWSPAGSLSDSTGAMVVASPSSTTTYTVNAVSSSGLCNSSGTINIKVNPKPNLQINPMIANICSGGSVELIASGAVNYNWLPSSGLNTSTNDTVIASPASTTTYTLIADNANGCYDSAFVTVQVSTALHVFINPSADSICPGSTTTLSAFGATTYQWSPSTGLDTTAGAMVNASPATTTVYTVIGQGGSGLCADTVNIEVVVFPAPNATFQYNDSICAGNNVSITVIMPGLNQLLVSPSGMVNGNTITDTPGSDIIYNITATDSNHCSIVQNISVSVLPLPLVSLSQANDTLLATAGFVQYEWYLNGILDTTTNTGQLIISNQGNWQVFVSDSYGCSDSSNTLLITGIESALSQNISIYPNPADQRVYIEMEHFTPGTTISLINISGMMQKIYHPLSSKFSLDISELTAGMYIITIKDNNSMKTLSLIVQ